MAKPARKYPKGVAKREEILQRALELVATHGFDAATVRQLAAASSLTTTGLLHHFGTKEELFTEILRRRDINDFGASLGSGGSDSFLTSILTRNTEVPGLIHLYTRLAADAIETSHTAHDFFAGRYASARIQLARSVRELQEAGAITPDAESEILATVLLAVMDGLQLQWLYDPNLDMEQSLSALLGILRPSAR